MLAVAGRDDRTGDVVVKVVNTGGDDADLELVLKGASVAGGTVTELASADPNAENSYDQPRRIAPVTDSIDVQGDRLKRRFPAYSISIVRLKSAKSR